MLQESHGHKKKKYLMKLVYHKIRNWYCVSIGLETYKTWTFFFTIYSRWDCCRFAIRHNVRHIHFKVRRLELISLRLFYPAGTFEEIYSMPWWKKKNSSLLQRKRVWLSRDLCRELRAVKFNSHPAMTLLSLFSLKFMNQDFWWN